MTSAVVHPTVERSVKRYLSPLDDLLGGVVTGFYLVGSVALGAYREGRSDIDFVAVVEGDLSGAELRRLRVLQGRSGWHTASAAIHHGPSALTGTCNGVFVRGNDLAAPV